MALNYVTFNQDYSSVAVGLSSMCPSYEQSTDLALGTSNGFRIFYTDPFAKRHETSRGDITLLEMLFSTSLVASVLSPRRLVITNTQVSSMSVDTAGRLVSGDKAERETRR